MGLSLRTQKLGGSATSRSNYPSPRNRPTMKRARNGTMNSHQQLQPLIKMAPAAQNNVDAKFIILDKDRITDGHHKTCLALIADETAAVHFQLWGDECDAFQPGDIVLLSKGIFSYNRTSLVLRAGKRGKVQKVGEFNLPFVETPNLSEIHWALDPLDGKYVQKIKTIFGISLSLIIINMASIMERADENLLPAIYKEVSEAFAAGPSDLGYLTFIRNFVQGLASPIAGMLAINYDRPKVLAVGIFCWALSTAAVGVSKYFFQVAFWRAINGIGLAIVIPSLQSFIADSYTDSGRGAGFGFLFLIGALGGIGGGAIATIMADYDFWGIPGWRCALILMATLSCLIGFLVYQFVIDPRNVDAAHDISNSAESVDRESLIDKNNTSSVTVWLESWTAMKAVMKVPTFRIIVLQGLAGSIPWTSMVFITMWFELIGFDHRSVATLVSFFAAGCALGSLFGGVVADRVSRKYPYSGRIMCAQFSAFMGIPFTLFLYKVIPQSVSSYYTYSTTLFFMGLIVSWPPTAAIGPMFAEVVHSKHRTMIYASDRAFEMSFSSFAAPIVGILSEKMYGYDTKSIDPVLGSAKEALALSRGLFAMMVVPTILCFLFYTPLYWTFKQDRENARIASIKETEML